MRPSRSLGRANTHPDNGQCRSTTVPSLASMASPSVRRQTPHNPCLPCDGCERWLYYRGDEEAVISEAQTRAIQNYRARLGERGLARFEVLGRDGDRTLIRSLARKLAEDTSEASALRAMISRSITGEPLRKGGILAALRRSPLVGADIDPTRSREEGRKVDL